MNRNHVKSWHIFVKGDILNMCTRLCKLVCIKKLHLLHIVYLESGNCT